MRRARFSEQTSDLIMLLLLSMAFAGGEGRAPSPAVVPSGIIAPPGRMALTPPPAGHRARVKIDATGASACLRVQSRAPAATVRTSSLAAGAKRSVEGDTGALAAATGGGAADDVGGGGGGGGDEEQSGAEAGTEAGNGAGATARTGSGCGVGGGCGKRRNSGKKSLQERLNDMRFDFSLGDREPYVAGAPLRLSQSQASPGSPSRGDGGASSSPSPEVAVAAFAGRGGAPQAQYHNYRRRKRPLNALCMPKYERAQGCAPLLPPLGTMSEPIRLVDHVAQELDRIGGDLSEFKSDLPCVANNTCPVPVFRCSKGHMWESNGQPVCFFCPVCAETRINTRARRKVSLEAIREIAKEKGGECIAEEYLGVMTRVAFRCGEGHEWLTTPANLVYKNTWCPVCAGIRVKEGKKLTIADMHQTARQFGGVFLSPEYRGAAIKHEWRCRRGHTFWNTPNNIRRSAGGRRNATFCKVCTMLDRSILKSAVVGGLDERDARRKLRELEAAGAAPTRKYFLKRRTTGKSQLAAKRRQMKRMMMSSSKNSGASASRASKPFR